MDPYETLRREHLLLTSSLKELLFQNDVCGPVFRAMFPAEKKPSNRDSLRDKIFVALASGSWLPQEVREAITRALDTSMQIPTVSTKKSSRDLGVAWKQHLLYFNQSHAGPTVGSDLLLDVHGKLHWKKLELSIFEYVKKSADVLLSDLVEKFVFGVGSSPSPHASGAPLSSCIEKACYSRFNNKYSHHWCDGDISRVRMYSLVSLAATTQEKLNPVHVLEKLAFELYRSRSEYDNKTTSGEGATPEAGPHTFVLYLAVLLKPPRP